MNILFRCFRRAPSRAAVASGAASVPAAVVPKVVVGWTEALVVKTAGAAGALVCVAVLVLVPVYGPAAFDTAEHSGVLVAPGPFVDAAPDSLARQALASVRADILNPPLLVPVTAAPSAPAGSWPGPLLAETPIRSSPPIGTTPGQPPQSAGHDQPVTIPEPGGLALFLAALAEGALVLALCAGYRVARRARA